jgi:hypothetical protein
MGLVDIEGKPYEEMFAAARSVDVAALHRGIKPLPVCTVVPRAPSNPLEGLRDWDRRNGFLRPASEVCHGDLYLAQDEELVYFGLYAMDYMDKSLYEGGKVPESERPRLRIRCGGLDLDIRYVADLPVTGDKGVRVKELPGLRHSVIIGVPKRLLPKDKLKIEVEAWTHSRGHRTAWKDEVSLR